ncbi:MAG: dTDP-4-dehydrorhamnose reductase [Saprospiraceae bacterium]|nr:dTDP-4-dehydrorhamnose reductase [Saprospiraceae bacterium]
MKSNPVRLLISGSDGQLGQSFRSLLSKSSDFVCHAFNKDELDITNSDSLNFALRNIKPDYFINCAAYTAVDKAESEPEKCFNINAEACLIISKALKNSNTKLLHFSSDYVYNQFNFFPLSEKNIIHPKGVYAKSKAAGENIILNSGIPALIFRTSWVYAPFGHNFVKTMIRLGSEKTELNVVNDQYGAPTYTYDLVNAVLHIIQSCQQNKNLFSHFPGIYNFSNEGIITWYDFANQIMFEYGLECKIHPILTSQYPTPASRPLWSVLSKHKIKKDFQPDIPHWLSSLRHCINEIKNQNANESV